MCLNQFYQFRNEQIFPVVEELTQFAVSLTATRFRLFGLQSTDRSATFPATFKYFSLEVCKKIIASQRQQCEPVSDDCVVGTNEWATTGVSYSRRRHT